MALARARSTFVCQNCGAVSSRWQGKCDACGEWNSLVEEITSSGVGAGPGLRKSRKGRVVALAPLAGDTEEAPRVVSGIGEFDRVTGGGIVRGSALLVGGDPGIGKSTLLLQAAGALARRGHRIVYISGEEAVAQVRQLPAAELARAQVLHLVGHGDGVALYALRAGSPAYGRHTALTLCDEANQLYASVPGDRR